MLFILYAKDNKMDLYFDLIIGIKILYFNGILNWTLNIRFVTELILLNVAVITLFLNGPSIILLTTIGNWILWTVFCFIIVSLRSVLNVNSSSVMISLLFLLIIYIFCNCAGKRSLVLSKSVAKLNNSLASACRLISRLNPTTQLKIMNLI